MGRGSGVTSVNQLDNASLRARDSDLELREIKVGEITVSEGINGRWNSLSIPQKNELLEVIEGTMSSREYAQRLRQQVRDQRHAYQLIGKPARGIVGRARLRRQHSQA